MEARYEARHATHRRLWRGDNLITRRVESVVELYPEFRLGYTEMTLDIANTHSWEENQQEAVYTFYLPEGAVASSLSLWIEGKEEFSRLSTKSKADEAYVQIVGRERRDPALLHWQEGNRVTVTVFPCTPQEARKFKIGFSYPLPFENDELVLSQIYFDGPPASLANETLEVRIKGEEINVTQLPLRFKQKDSHTYAYDGSYRPNWKLHMEAPSLSAEPFQFRGNQYSAHPIEATTVTFSPQTIVLDINTAWSRSEFEKVWGFVKNKKVMAFTPGEVTITEENKDKVFSYLNRNQFSLLPIQHIQDPAQTLVISKSTASAPLLSDLENSIFASELSTYLVGLQENIQWFNLGSQQSPFVQSLNNFQLLDYMEGDLTTLQDMFNTARFTYYPHESHRMNLYGAGMQLVRLDSLAASQWQEKASGAPDHLMRLFVYQELLGSIGRQYFDREALEETWIRQAEEAYVASPVSSLIVLESQKDYERTGIEENRDTLGNASLKNSGAVPEPEEWMLIFLIVLVLGWQIRLRLLQAA